MGRCDMKILCDHTHDETEFILERFERLLRKNTPEKILQELKTQTRERLILLSKSNEHIASAAFLINEFHRALEHLTKAIKIFPSPALFAKRSVVHLAMENYQLAAADATCAIGLDLTFPSGYFCRALALIHLRYYEIALSDLGKLRQCLPNSKKCNQLYIRCRNQFWGKGEMEPFETPQNISEVAVNEEYSVFLDQRIIDLKVELSTSGVIEASKFTEEFIIRVIDTYKQGIFHLPQKHVFMILQIVLEILKEHENIVSIDITNHQTLTVVGDLRGNFHNLMSIFNRNHSPQFGRPYLFNGNIIGDYNMSLPCMVIILCMKILFSEDVFINRGSEECLEKCETNGFENEVLTVYDEEVMKGFTEVFNWLPVAHVLNNSVMIVHGGIFENKNITLADIQEMKRCYQPPDKGPLCDILHSDPWNQGGISNAHRQRGVWFGPDAALRFCKRNCLDYIIRSHQKPNALGYEAQLQRHCITVNSSTQHATYLRISGETSTFHVLHGRKEMKIPKNCSCWIMCNCHTNKQLQDQPLTEYAAFKLDLLPVPSEPSTKSFSVPSSSRSLLQSKSSNVLSKPRSQSSTAQAVLTNESDSSRSHVITVFIHEQSGSNLLNYKHREDSKTSSNLAQTTQSVTISQHSDGSTSFNTSPNIKASAQPSIESNPTITESDTVDEPEIFSTKRREVKEENGMGSTHRTDSPSEGDQSGSKEELIHQLVDRSKARSEHWLMSDRPSPAHSAFSTEELQEVGASHFDLYHFDLDQEE